MYNDDTNPDTKWSNPTADRVYSKDSEPGFLYLIQIAPDLNETRIKLGWAKDVENRLRAHKVSAPTAVLVKQWNCRRIRERAAIHHVAPMASRKLTGEMYEFPDLKKLISALDDYFLVLDTLGDGRPYVPSPLPVLRKVSGDPRDPIPENHKIQKRLFVRPDPLENEGRVFEFEVKIPADPHLQGTHTWLNSHIWKPLNDYIVEVASVGIRPQERILRVRIEVVK